MYVYKNGKFTALIVESWKDSLFYQITGPWKSLAFNDNLKNDFTDFET